MNYRFVDVFSHLTESLLIDNSQARTDVIR
jgi:hypothetical protein